MLGGISDNMASLVKLGKYGAINSVDTTAMGYYVIKYLSEPYTLQEVKTKYGQVSKSAEPVVKSEYLSLMKTKKMVLATSWKNQSVLI